MIKGEWNLVRQGDGQVAMLQQANLTQAEAESLALQHNTQNEAKPHPHKQFWVAIHNDNLPATYTV